MIKFSRKFKADIFLPTSKNLATLEMCLLSLNKQSDTRFRVLLVGRDYDPKVEKLLGKFQRFPVKYIIQKNKGLVGAANEAYKMALAEWFIRIDDDVVVHRRWFENAVKEFKSRKVGAVTGPTLISKKGIKNRDSLRILFSIKRKNNDPKLKILIPIYRFIYENKQNEVGSFLCSGAFTMGANLESSQEIGRKYVQNVEACNFACRTKLLKKFGGFDTTFINGLGEYHEADLAQKIIHAGYKIIFNSKMKLWHKVEYDPPQKSRPDAFYRIFNFIIFYRKHLMTKNLRCFRKFIAYVLLQNLYYLYKAVQTKNFNQILALFGTVYAFIYPLGNKK